MFYSNAYDDICNRTFLKADFIEDGVSHFFDTWPRIRSADLQEHGHSIFFECLHESLCMTVLPSVKTIDVPFGSKFSEKLNVPSSRFTCMHPWWHMQHETVTCVLILRVSKWRKTLLRRGSFHIP